MRRGRLDPLIYGTVKICVHGARCRKIARGSPISRSFPVEPTRLKLHPPCPLTGSSMDGANDNGPCCHIVLMRVSLIDLTFLGLCPIRSAPLHQACRTHRNSIEVTYPSKSHQTHNACRTNHAKAGGRPSLYLTFRLPSA